MRANIALQTFEHFIPDFQPFEPDDPHKVFATLPRLALFQFHGGRIINFNPGSECFGAANEASAFARMVEPRRVELLTF
jgi:hypothetical protein